MTTVTSMSLIQPLGTKKTLKQPVYILVQLSTEAVFISCLIGLSRLQNFHAFLVRT